jgi:hypothetical protein
MGFHRGVKMDRLGTGSKQVRVETIQLLVHVGLDWPALTYLSLITNFDSKTTLWHEYSISVNKTIVEVVCIKILKQNFQPVWLLPLYFVANMCYLTHLRKNIIQLINALKLPPSLILPHIYNLKAKFNFGVPISWTRVRVH